MLVPVLPLPLVWGTGSLLRSKYPNTKHKNILSYGMNMYVSITDLVDMAFKRPIQIEWMRLSPETTYDVL